MDEDNFCKWSDRSWSVASDRSSCLGCTLAVVFFTRSILSFWFNLYIKIVTTSSNDGENSLPVKPKSLAYLRQAQAKKIMGAKLMNP